MSTKATLSGYLIGICLVCMLGYPIFFPESGDFLLKLGHFVLWFISLISLMVNVLIVIALILFEPKKSYEIVSEHFKQKNLINIIFSNILFASLLLLCIHNNFYILAFVSLLNKIIAFSLSKHYENILLEGAEEEEEENEIQ